MSEVALAFFWHQHQPYYPDDLTGENAMPWTIEEGKVFRRKDFYMIRTFYFPKADFDPNIVLLRRYKDEYRVLVDGEFGLRDLPQNFARFAEGKLIKPVLALETS